jgi:hypothetical protein
MASGARKPPRPAVSKASTQCPEIRRESSKDVKTLFLVADEQEAARDSVAEDELFQVFISGRIPYDVGELVPPDLAIAPPVAEEPSWARHRADSSVAT